LALKTGILGLVVNNLETSQKSIKETVTFLTNKLTANIISKLFYYIFSFDGMMSKF